MERWPWAARVLGDGSTETDIGRLDFEVFWSRERDRLYRALALTLGDPGLAAEAVDEAMVRALERWKQVGTYDQPAGWTYRVALNWATSRRRKLARRPIRPSEDLDRPVMDALPDIDLAAQLGRLSRRHRTVVVLRFYLQFTPAEIADLLNLPSGTVRSRLHRALDTLRDLREVTK